VSSGSSGRSTGITGPDAAAADRPAASGCWAGLLLAGCWMVAGHQPSHVSLVIWAPPALLIGRERGLALAGRARRQNSATAEAACKQGVRTPSTNPRWRSGTNHYSTAARLYPAP
jgi:hypothetical protein